MNRPYDELADFYDHLNRDHQGMRDRLLSQLPSRDTHRRGGGSYRLLARSGAGLAAAILVVASTWGVLYWSPSVTLAQVKFAVAQQKWVKLAYEDGEEYWVSLRDGRRFQKLPSGRIFFSAPGTWLQYFPGNFPANTHWTSNGVNGSSGPGRIEDSRASAEEMKQLPKWEPTSAWDYIVGKAEDAVSSKADANRRIRTERHEESVDGRRLVRFDTIYVDALDNEKLRSQLWADLVTRLPVRSRKSKSFFGADRNDDSAFVAGVFIFQETGPADIFALGASRKAEIVQVSWKGDDRSETKDVPAELRALITDAQASADNFPPRLRIVKWPAEEFVDPSVKTIEIVYWNGRPTRKTMNGRSYRDWSSVNIRELRYSLVDPLYFLVDDERLSLFLPVPKDLPAVLTWAAGQKPNIRVSDGNRTYSLTGLWHASSEQVKPTLNAVRIPGNSAIPLDQDWPVKMQWPYIFTFGSGHHELVSNPPEARPGTVLLRYTTGAPHHQRADYYISPDHDYICLKQIWWQARDNDWHKISEYELSDLRQLPSKTWWAAKESQLGFNSDGSTNHDGIFLIDVAPLDKNEFPTAAFDGDKLLEEAKTLDAEIIAK